MRKVNYFHFAVLKCLKIGYMENMAIVSAKSSEKFSVNCKACHILSRD